MRAVFQKVSEATPATTLSLALKMRTEGMGIRATGRVLEKSHFTGNCRDIITLAYPGFMILLPLREHQLPETRQISACMSFG